MHLLVIEDERALCETIVRSLRRLAYSVDYCYDGEKALELLSVERYDLVLLDLNLPGKDGMTVLRTLRQTDRETRVLILSARGEVEDKVEGLDAGANDYLAKPFHLAELEARIRSLTLRQFTQQDVLLSCGGLTFDTRSRTATVNGQTLTLTRKETGILEYLMVHQGRPVSQEELMDHVWDNSVDSFSNSIRVHISALRKKLRAVLGYDPIRSLTLRQFTQQDVLLSCGSLSFDTRSRTAAVNGQTLTLTRKETGILEYLMVHQGRPVSQEELMDHVWDNSVDSFSNSIRVHISALRKKLRAALGYDPIRNRIGEGYLMGGEEE